MKCPNCGYKTRKDRQFCQHCLWNLYGPNSEYKTNRRGLTEWEKQKLSFYRDEKKWVEHIQNRKIVYQNGKQHVILTDGKGNYKGEVPMQPKKYWPKPKEI